MLRKIAAIFASACLLLLCGCSSMGGSNKPSVAVSIVPQATFAKAVAGDLWDIKVIIPSGSSPETYEPSTSDRMALEDADIYFAIGVPAEEASILPLIEADTKLVKTQDVVAKKYADILMDGGRDPHIWLSPKRVIEMVNCMADEFSSYDPANEEIYRANAAAYIAKLNDLDTYVTQKLSGIENRKFIVFHPAFGYLADDYGLEMYALQEEGREATLQHMQQMADLAKSEGIKAVFYQAETDSKQAEAFAQQIGGQTVMLAPLAENYIENIKGMADLLAATMK